MRKLKVKQICVRLVNYYITNPNITHGHPNTIAPSAPNSLITLHSIHYLSTPLLNKMQPFKNISRMNFQIFFRQRQALTNRTPSINPTMDIFKINNINSQEALNDL